MADTGTAKAASAAGAPWYPSTDPSRSRFFWHVQAFRQRLLNHPGHADQKSHGRRGGRTGQDALDAVPAKLSAASDGHHGRYGDESLAGPDGTGSARALAEYEGTEYQKTNVYLRDPEGMAQALKDHPDALAAIRERVSEIDQTMSASRLEDDVEVDRVIQRGADVFGQDTWYGPDVMSSDMARSDEGWDRWDAGERPDLTGLRWREKGYVSTTADPTITSHYGDRYKRANSPGEGEPVVLKIRAPAGTGAVQMSPMNSDGKGEGEILLERGLTMQVTADRGVVDGLRILEVEVVPE